MIDKQAAIKAIQAGAACKLIDDVYALYDVDSWIGGVLYAIDTIRRMDEADNTLTLKPVCEQCAMEVKHDA